MTQRDLIRDANTGRNIRVVLFAKDKGGVGSTGTLATVHYHLLQKDERPILVEASTQQNDILKPYRDRHTVLEVDLDREDGVSTFLNQLEQTPAGSYVLMNIPGRSLIALEKIHTYLQIFNEISPIKAETTTVWTMGRDAPSRNGLDAMLDGDLPGRVLLNLPEWAGLPKDFDNVDEELFDRVLATGGSVFCCPKLTPQLFHLFQGKQSIGLDAIEKLPGLTMGPRAEFLAWKGRVAKNFSKVF